MNELQLPSNLLSIATKINSHKNNIGYSFIEIGKELIRAKKEDIQHGEWQLFLDEINMSRTQAQRHITVTEQYNMGKLPDVGTIGLNAMYEIATLPEEKRHEAINEDGTAKSVREIRELKRQNRELEQAKQQAEAQAEQARKSEEIAIKKLEEEQSKEPEVIERNIVPDDYDKLKGGYAALEGTMNFYKEQNEELRNELKQLEQMIKDEQQERPNSDLLEELKESEEKLKEKINETYKFHELQSNLEQLLSMVLPLEHTINFDKLKDEHEMVSTFESTLDGLVDWCNDIKEKLPNNNIIEGEFIDE